MNRARLAQHAQDLAASGAFGAQAACLPSPCISVCRMNPERSHCEGCFRTLDELRAWRAASAFEQRAIWAHALARAALALPPELAPAPVLQSP